MPRRTVREDAPDAESAGAQYAQEQLEGDYFMDWVHSQIAEAERMDPSKVLPLETKDDAREIARNMLQQLYWDTSRDLEPREIARLIGVDDTTQEDVKEFFKGFRSATNSARDWLADELLEIKGGMRGGVREAPRSRGRSSFRIGQPVQTTMGVRRSGRVIAPVSKDQWSDGTYRPPGPREDAVWVQWSDGTKGWSHAQHLAPVGEASPPSRSIWRWGFPGWA